MPAERTAQIAGGATAADVGSAAPRAGGGNGHRPAHRHAPERTPQGPREPATIRPAGAGSAGQVVRSGPDLRAVLVATDVVAVGIGWALAGMVVGPRLPIPWLGALPVIVALSLLTLAVHDLYRSSACATIAMESLGVTRSVGRLAVPGSLWAAATGGTGGLVAAITVSGLLWSSLLAGRAGYRAWLRRCRRAGAYTSPMLLVGGDRRSLDLADLIRRRPQLGYRIVGVVGPRDGWDGAAPSRLGGLDGLERVVRETDVTAALVDAGTLGPDDLNRAVRTLNRLGVNVHVSSGLRGIATHRLRPHPVGHEPFLYVQPIRMSVWAQRLKRTFDVIAGSLLLVLALPVLAGAAVAIRLDDRGPVLFRQTRVGQGGQPFTMYKLRTMSVDAEDRREELRGRNEREGPLFKVAGDPRVTRIGRLLRTSSIDELPQLVNVIGGQMSLVGPRPALPEEVAEFDDELVARADVKPGLSGLWQVEARDDASFDVYRRLDLFYVENWSLGLDVTIVLLTIPVVLGRLLRAVRRRVGRHHAEVIVLD